MKLLIVESPSKAKTIEKYLDNASASSADRFTVRASVGHIRDLPKSNKKAIDIEAGFVPHYEISKGKEHVVNELQNLAEKAKEIMLATDPDREGEAIAWHIEEILKHDKKVKAPIKRVTFHEITKEAVEEAIKHPRAIDTDLRKAQEARRVLDRLVGYDLSGIIWKKVRYGLSAGRVQSPALRIIMEREREIRAFIPEKYWVLEGIFDTLKKDKITLTCNEEPRDEKFVENILEIGKKGNWIVAGIKESEQKRSPRAPFTTSTLQQTASTRLGFSPSRTMQVAQKLYEAGHITYMRTDSTNLSAVAQKQILDLVEKKYGKEYTEAHTYKTKSKNAQEAHEAIRPTHIEYLSKGANDEQEKLYKLIWERAVSSQMTDAKLLKTKISAIVENHEEIPEFSANGSRVIFPGWLKVDADARGEDVELPEVKKGEKLNLIDLVSIAKETQPPGRYSEAGLVKELEARGIGRPSTYASIMRTIEERGYVRKEGKTLFPTDTGEVVSDFLEKNFAEYISDTFTAEMEDKLDDISRGEREYEKTLKDFYGPFLKEVKEKDKLEKATNMGEAPDDIKCPKCGGKMIIKLARVGKFYSCANYPDCEGALMLDGTELQGPKETGEKCPTCGDKKGKSGGGKLVIRERRDGTGTFISCSRYPKCKFVKQDEEEIKRKMTDVTCPVCKKNKMMERRGRFGIFYSCSSYPECKNAIKAKPTGRICDLCGSLMMEGTKTIPERCSNKLCKMHNPHKLNKMQ
ncbi:type I DNA topoisomerase [Candidatus Nomurabacteria bacterium]|nr:type I DNA topoisomerase [Candidatus Nomurabacteria bacterium]